jgi:hypothetical protein
MFTEKDYVYFHHQYRCEFKFRSGEEYSIQHYVIKLVSNLLQVGGFWNEIWSILRVPSDFGSRNKQSFQLGNACRVVCFEFAGLNCIVRILKYFYNVNNLYDVFTKVAGDTILKFLKEINQYTKI